MDRTSAVNLIKSTFENAFDRDRYTNLVWNLLKNPERTDDGPWCGQMIPAAFRSHIKSYMRIGKYYSPEEERIDLLIINLHKESSLAQARTLQRNFIRWYLKYGRNGADKDAVLAAVVSPGDGDWRFSLVKMEYALEATASGSIDAQEKLTPARRYSFIVGKNEKSHTAQQALLPLLLDDQSQPSLAQLEQSFNVEKITNEFFEKYKELFHKLREALIIALDEQPTAKSEFEKKGVNTADFTKKLLGQIVFLYFLQKKGWFGVARDAEWGTGPKDYLRSLFDKATIDYGNFFNDILEPLFYYTLARPRQDDYSDKLNCKIPFLNGGLFDPLNDYDWLHTDILLPNELFSNDEKTPEGDIGTGILDVFDRYNFTVCEDEPLEKEVAVDPEMLGKVFEKLLEVSDRKSKGAFYTPREIVHYMCQESLINYLGTEVPAVGRSDIELLIRSGDTTIENDAAAEEHSTYDYKLPPAIRKNASTIDDILADIRVCDPAVGSGAFIVGMMNEIVRARLALARPANRNHSPYRLKRNAIQNCLYGVDIDPGAVEIAKLRLWLSLVVDEEERASIQPLPNLDYKIMQGNSLLDEYHGVKLFDDIIFDNQVDSADESDFILAKLLDVEEQLRKWRHSDSSDRTTYERLTREKKALKNRLVKPTLSDPNDAALPLWTENKTARDKAEELKKLRVKFFGQSNAEDKKKIKAQIEALGWELIEASLKEQGKDDALTEVAQFREKNIKPFFLWKLNFPEVFERQGFDVVVANPPYVDSETMTREDEAQRNRYANLYESAKGNWDLFIIFIERGMSLLRHDGVISYIVPNKLVGATYSETIRNMIADNCVVELRDYSEVKVFKEASVYPVVFVVQKSECRDNVLMVSMASLESSKSKNLIPPSLFYEDIYWDRYFAPTELVNLLVKMSVNACVRDFFDRVHGAATVNEAYLLKKYLREHLQDAPADKPFKKFVNTGTIDPYISLWGAKKTQYIKDGYNRPIVFDDDIAHVSENRLAQANSEKIIIGGMTKRLECFYDNGAFIPGKSTTVVLPGDDIDLKCLLCVLNSKLISLWYRVFFNSLSLAGGYLQIGNAQIKRIPLPKIALDQQNRLITIADEICMLTAENGHLSDDQRRAEFRKCERIVDQVVYELYQLTTEEVALVEQSGN